MDSSPLPSLCRRHSFSSFNISDSLQSLLVLTFTLEIILHKLPWPLYYLIEICLWLQCRKQSLGHDKWQADCSPPLTRLLPTLIASRWLSDKKPRRCCFCWVVIATLSSTHIHTVVSLSCGHSGRHAALKVAEATPHWLFKPRSCCGSVRMWSHNLWHVTKSTCKQKFLDWKKEQNKQI